MTKEEATALGLAQLQASVESVIGDAFDAGASSVAGGGLTQADVDAKIAEALAADEIADQSVLNDLQSRLQLDKQQMEDLKTSLSTLLGQAMQIVAPTPTEPVQA